MKKVVSICENLKEYLSREEKTTKPLVGIIIDWHIIEKSKNEYIHQSNELSLNLYIQLIIRSGAKPYIINYDDYKCLPEILKKLDGLILPGGRDIPPCFYNQENKGSHKSKESKIRYNFYKCIMDIVDKKLPIFGICYGYQFINIYFGGSMVQHLEDPENKHYNVNKIIFKENSWFEKNFGDKIYGSCAHHQNLNRIGENIKVVGYDAVDKTPHALELDDPERFVKGVLWHPERIHVKGDSEKYYLQPTDENINILKSFIEVCECFRISKIDN